MKSGFARHPRVFTAHSLRISLLASAVALACPAWAAAQFRGDDPDAPLFGWLSSLGAGKERARAEGKPLMVVIRCVP